MEYYKAERYLTDENIGQIVPELTEIYLSTVKRRKWSETKFRLALEEILLHFRDYYGMGAPCTVTFYKRFGKYAIEVSQPGIRKDFLPDGEDLKYSRDILESLGVEPRYVFSRGAVGRNRLLWEESLIKPKKHSMMTSIAIAAVLAVLAGLLINLLPKELHDSISTDFIAPVLNKLTNILAALATPLVFFAVISGIVGIGNVRSFGAIGSRVLRRMGGTYLVAGCLMALGCIVAYGLPVAATTAADGGSQSAFGQVLQLVLNIIPDNLVAPFAADNDLQVIVIAIFVGVAMLVLGNKLPRLNEVVQEGTELINKMMLFCCQLLPLIVFCGVTNLIVSSNADQFVDVGKMIVVYLVANGIFLLHMIIRARVTTGVPFKTIFSKQLATLLINITTASQVVALPENMKCCKRKFGIDEKLVGFALPLGIVVFMPSGAIYLGLTMWGLLVVQGTTITMALMIKMILVCIIVAIAAPPIPGSAFVVMPVLFASCGLSNEVLPLAIIFGTIIGYVLPAFNGFNIQLELLMTAKKLGKVDEAVLKAPYVEPAEKS